jgi:tetratricopeptide (TPR) repeat protein
MQLILLIAASCALSGCSWLDKVRGHPSLEAQNLIEQARSAEIEGNVEQAGSLLHQAIEANPEDVEAHRELARLLLDQGAVDAAVDQLRLAVGQRPDDIDSYTQLARIQLDHKRFRGAERDITSALAIDPEHVESLLLKAELAELHGRDALAMETYYRVLSRDPESVVGRLRLAELQIATGHPDRAAPLLRALCECTAANEDQRAAALWSLGIVYGQRGRWREAATALAASASDRRAMTADDWYRVAYARYTSRDFNGAWSDADRALRLRPDHRRAVAMHSALREIGNRRRPDSQGGNQRVAMVVPVPTGW